MYCPLPSAFGPPYSRDSMMWCIEWCWPFTGISIRYTQEYVRWYRCWWLSVRIPWDHAWRWQRPLLWGMMQTNKYANAHLT